MLNDPINFIDPLGLIKWGTVVKGGLKVAGGVTSVVLGTAASSTAAGAVAGVPMVIGGAAGVGVGVTEIITGFLDVDPDIPPVSASSLATLACSGDKELAKKVDMAQNIVEFGISGGEMAAKVASDLEIVNTGLGFVNVVTGAQDIDFSK